MVSDEELQEVYDSYISLTAELLKTTPPEAIAGVMAAQALSLYKTCLSPEDYNYIVEALYNSKDNIKSFDLGVTLQ